MYSQALKVLTQRVATKSSHVLITGGTGTIASLILTDLLKFLPSVGSDHKVTVLARGRDEGHARERVEGLVQEIIDIPGYCNRSEYEAVKRGMSAANVVVGDLEHGRELGAVLPVADITHVISCGSNTSMKAPLEVSRKANVDGLPDFVSLFAGSTKLERFVHMGTAYSAGGTNWGQDLPSPDRTRTVLDEDDYMRDDDLPELEKALALGQNDHYHNYTFTKGLGELRMRKLARETDIPLVIVRPSIVVGHTGIGCGFSGSIFFTFRILHRLGHCNWPLDYSLDVTSCDYISAATLGLAFKDQLAHSLYHLTAGETSCTNWREIAEKMHRHNSNSILEDDAYKGEWPLRLAPEDEDTTPCAPYTETRLPFGKCFRRKRLLESFPENAGLFSYAIRQYEPYIQTAYVFNNRRSLDEGLPQSIPLPNYVHECLRYGEPLTVQVKEDF